MSAKATAIAPANIAFIKYWGARDLTRAIPNNPSISMTLERCFSRCTVEYLRDARVHEVLLAGSGGALLQPPIDFAKRILEHLDRLREATRATGAFRVATFNSFPSSAGLASSASGFAALTLAVAGALGLRLSDRELSELARESGSGSAARSALGGYVQWPAGDDEEHCYAVRIAAPEDWELRDVIAIVDDGPKPASSLVGHGRAETSPYYAVRQSLLPSRLARVRDAIARRCLADLGPVLEEEAIDLHLIAMSSRPPIFYWKPGTLAVLQAVRELRAEGFAAYATIDAGANVHVICDPKSEATIARRLDALIEVRAVVRDRVGQGPRLVDEHLF